MKKPEPPKEFDEEIVLAKVRTSTFEWNVFIVTVFLWINYPWIFKSTAFNFRLKNMQELVVDLREKQKWS